jgi:hypothetical protein
LKDHDASFESRLTASLDGGNEWIGHAVDSGSNATPVRDSTQK